MLLPFSMTRTGQHETNIASSACRPLRHSTFPYAQHSHNKNDDVKLPHAFLFRRLCVFALTTTFSTCSRVVEWHTPSGGVIRSRLAGCTTLTKFCVYCQKWSENAIFINTKSIEIRLLFPFLCPSTSGNDHSDRPLSILDRG